MSFRTTKSDVATLLETFADYVNPAGEEDPWFTLAEINQQFAWDDIPTKELTSWLDEMVNSGLARTEKQDGERVWAWLS